jgi:hypothetical protein
MFLPLSAHSSGGVINRSPSQSALDFEPTVAPDTYSVRLTEADRSFSPEVVAM